MERPLDHLGGLVRTVTAADSIGDALARIAAGLEDTGIGPRVVGVALFEGPDAITFVASWTPVETFFTPGVTISGDLTPATSVAIAQVRAGNLLSFDVDDVDLGLVSDVFRSEGLRTIIAIPLRSEGVVEGFLGVGCVVARPLEELEMVLFDAFGRGIGDALLRLADDLPTGPDQSG